jgi:hypothetical protein
MLITLHATRGSVFCTYLMGPWDEQCIELMILQTDASMTSEPELSFGLILTGLGS